MNGKKIVGFILLFISICSLLTVIILGILEDSNQSEPDFTDPNWDPMEDEEEDNPAIPLFAVLFAFTLIPAIIFLILGRNKKKNMEVTDRGLLMPYSPEDVNTKFCSNCGKQVPTTAEMCPFCNMKFVQEY